MNPTLSPRLNKVLNGLQARNFDMTTASEYGEPGYSTDKPFIVFANWNDLKKSTIKLIEDELEIEWSDEWLTDDQGRAFRTQADSHGWTPAWFEHDGEVVPNDSLSGDADELRAYGFIFEPGDSTGFKSVPDTVDLKGIASLVEDDCQTGFHLGQNDSPAKKLLKLPPGEYCFQIDGKGQFDCTWSIWRLNDED